MDALPLDLFYQICSYLINDGRAIGRLSLCNKGLHDRLTVESRATATRTEPNPSENSNNHNARTQTNALWKELYDQKWIHASSKQQHQRQSATTHAPTRSVSDSQDPEDHEEEEENYQKGYIRRITQDQWAVEILNLMTKDLEESSLLGLSSSGRNTRKEKVSSSSSSQTPTTTVEIQDDNNVNNNSNNNDNNNDDDGDADFTVSANVDGNATLAFDSNPHVGQAWDHPLWMELLQAGGDVMDVLREQTQLLPLKPPPQQQLHTACIKDIDFETRSTITVHQRIRAFLAARCLQNIHFTECLVQWTRLREVERREQLQQLEIQKEQKYFPSPPTRYQEEEDHHQHVGFNSSSLLLEEYALLINDMQQTPVQLLLPRRTHLTQNIRQRLDDMAHECSRLFFFHNNMENNNKNTTPTHLSTLEKLQRVRDYMVHHQGFQGNTEDYYNYRNSLLDCVLESKRGIPITLAILYTCICRRLGLSTFMVGLPGHVVLGCFIGTQAENEDFDNNNDNIKKEKCVYMDVFQKGEFLTVADCQRIAASYQLGWDPSCLQPLAPCLVLQRILNNLSNCHLHSLATGQEAFQSDLFFNQRALASIHRHPPSIAATLVDRITQELPLTMSPDLLRYYGLLSPAATRHLPPTTTSI